MKKKIGAQKFIKINDISEQDILKLLKTKAKKNSFYGCCVTQLQKKKKCKAYCKEYEYTYRTVYIRLY